MGRSNIFSFHFSGRKSTSSSVGRESRASTDSKLGSKALSLIARAATVLARQIVLYGTRVIENEILFRRCEQYGGDIAVAGQTYTVALETRVALFNLFFPIVGVTTSFVLDRSFGSRMTAKQTSRYLSRSIVPRLKPPMAARRRLS